MTSWRVVTIPAICLVTVAATTIAGYSAFVRSDGDLIAVEPSVAYRSGPLKRTFLEQTVLREGLRTVLDVGTDPADAAEMSIVQGYGLRYVRFPFPRDGDASLARMKSFAKILSEVPQPVLIRCSNGTSGTRLASALFEVAVMGRTPDQAWRASSTALAGLFLEGEAGAGKTAFDEFVMHREAVENSVVAR